MAQTNLKLSNYMNTSLIALLIQIVGKNKNPSFTRGFYYSNLSLLLFIRFIAHLED